MYYTLLYIYYMKSLYYFYIHCYLNIFNSPASFEYVLLFNPYVFSDVYDIPGRKIKNIFLAKIIIRP